MRSFNTSGISRLIAGITGLMMLVFVLFSAFYIAAETDHECCGEDCPICACVHLCENALHGFDDGAAVQSAAVAPFILILPVAAFAATACQETPVSQKVRMNN